MIILGIETSCDETAVSLVNAQKGNLNVLSNVVSSQIKLHAKWGGVVPNLAAREHLKNIIPVLKTAFKKADIKPSAVDLMAVTQGPGLIPALLIGTNAAKTLSYVWEKPLIGIHHIEGHIYANFIGDKISVNSKTKNPELRVTHYKLQDPFPLLCMVVSGGHTQLVLMKNHLDYEIIGQTLDDAVGEAFDKTARILELGYPGGPIISQLATRNSQLKKKNDFRINLPRPMIDSDDFNFSFSGLKTAVLYKAKEFQKNKKLRFTSCELQKVIASEFQQAAIDVLVYKTVKAAQEYKPKTIMLAGGVSANKELRKQFKKNIKENFSGVKCIMPNAKYSTDNAAMIAAAAYYRWKGMDNSQRKKALQNWQTLQADANLKLV